MKLLDFFLGSRLGGLAAGALMVSALVVLWQVDRAGQRDVGRLQEQVKTEKKTDEIVKRSDRVRRKSRDRRVPGRLDPNTVYK